MNDAKHTKGPWEVGEWITSQSHAVYKLIHGVGRNVSAVCVYGARKDGTKSGKRNVSVEECDANARLIAAAPDLLEALQRCATLMKNGFIPPENIGKDAEEIVSGDYANGWDAACEEFRNSRTAEIAQAAIAKAEGR